jgi:hypothetical protein
MVFESEVEEGSGSMKLTTLDARPHENAPNLGRKEHRYSKLHGGKRNQIRQPGGYPGAELQILSGEARREG